VVNRASVNLKPRVNLTPFYPPSCYLLPHGVAVVVHSGVVYIFVVAAAAAAAELKSLKGAYVDFYFVGLRVVFFFQTGQPTSCYIN